MSSSGSQSPYAPPTDPCGANQPSSEKPIRYGDGEVMLEESDLEGAAFGLSWGHARSYGNQLSYNSAGLNGNSWLAGQEEYLVRLDGQTVAVMAGMSATVWFKLVAGQWRAELGRRQTLRHDVAAGEYELVEEGSGLAKVFYDEGAAVPFYLRGKLKRVVAPGGRVALIARDGQGRITQWKVTDEDGLNGLEFDYEYHAIGAGAGNLATVTQVALAGGVGQAVRRASYAYYGQADANGNYRDLKSATLEQWEGAAWVELRASVYRYYKGWQLGFPHGLRYVLGPESVRQMRADGLDPLSAPDAQAAGYADYYFEYDGQRRVTREVTNAGRLTFTFAYSQSGFGDGYNHWKTKTVHTRPDGTQEIVYCNFKLELILRVLKAGAAQWYEYRRYNDNGQVLDAATSAAVASYNEASPGLVTLKPNTGLIHISRYFAATNLPAGAVLGYLDYSAVKEGGNGAETKLSSFTYVARTAGTRTVIELDKETQYRSAAGGGSDPVVTHNAMTWQSGTVQIDRRTTTLPVVPVGENGDGQTYQRQEIEDLDGFNTWSRNELGIITRQVFNQQTGTMERRIEDVQTQGAAGVPSGWMTPVGAGKNLVSDFAYDLLGRRTLELGPAHTIDLEGVATVLRRAAFTVHRDALDEEWSAQGYAVGSAPGYGFKVVSPVAITRRNQAGRVTDEIQALYPDANGACGSEPLSAADRFPQASWVRWSSHGYDAHDFEVWQRDYFAIPPEEGDAGLPGVHYDQSDFGYDAMGRRNRVRSPDGTITRTVFDAQGQTIGSWVGTDDTGATNADPSGGGAAGNNMVKVTAIVYDGGQPGGNGLETSETQYASASDLRVTSYLYDWRDRQVGIDGEDGYYQKTDYDNLGRPTAQERRLENAAGRLLARHETLSDVLGRSYRQKQYGVNPVTGALTGQALVENVWFDGLGQVIKRQRAGRRAWEKTHYGSLGEEKATFLCYPANGQDDGATNVVTNDIVIAQHETGYDAARNAVETRRLLRFHNATGNGALNGPNATQPRARIYTRGQWPDALGRTVAQGDYGTAGGAPVARPALIPASSDAVPVSRTEYDATGQVRAEIDPRGIVTRRSYDDLARATKIIENGGATLRIAPVCGTASQPLCGPIAQLPPDSRTTSFSYAPGSQLATLTLQNAETGAQVTQWKYGTTLAGSGVATGHLLREKIAPDGGRTLYAYNRLSQPLSATDANGTVHLFDYSKRGLLRHDRVTTLGGGINGDVRRISTSYDALERLWKVGSYWNVDPAYPYPNNEVAREYDAFGQLAREWQHPFGSAVNSYAVTYTHANGSSNTARLTRITYPSGRQVEPTYGAANGVNDWLSRVAGVRDAGENLQVADYQFLGEDTAVISTYNQPAVALSYLKQGAEANGEAGDQYAGLDRFGRDIDHRWLKGGTDLERIGYGYDPAGLRTWRSEAVAAAQGKLFDDHYGYDGLSQVKAREQGRLNPSRTGINGIPAQAEAWDYDPAGNWDNYLRQANGATEIDQTRTHTKANEIRVISDHSTLNSQPSTFPPAYDPVGNMTRVPQTETGSDYYTIEWDAWNRPVYIFNPFASHSGSQGSGYPSEDWDQTYYSYDGLHRRVQAYAWGNYYYRASYCWYDDQWKCIEERDDNWRLTTYLFGARGRNDLVSRDWQDDAWATQRHYALCDAMSSKVALTDASGTVVERYTYSTFGQSQVLDPDWNPRSESLYDWQTRFHGETRDPDTGWYNYGYRYYNPMLGRWLNRDPAGEQAGSNLNAYAANDAINQSDYLGLDCIAIVHRPVVYPTYHYSIEWLTGCCPKKGEEISYKKCVGEGKRLHSKAKLELLNIQGVTAEHYGSYAAPSGGGKATTYRTGWKRIALAVTYGISAIHRDVKNSKDSLFATIYNDSEGKIQQKWQAALQVGRNYAYAEQGRQEATIQPYQLRFEKFPRSIYYAFGNNSNVFVRYVLKQIGVPMKELKGSHPPGNRDEPRDETWFRNYRDPRSRLTKR